MTEFQKHYQADNSYLWWQSNPGRYISSNQYQLVEWLSFNNIPDEIAYIPPIEQENYFLVSKLKLRRILRANGLEAVFDAALASNQTWFKDWNDANELKSDDPIFIEALPALASYAGITTEQANQLLLSASI